MRAIVCAAAAAAAVLSSVGVARAADAPTYHLTYLGFAFTNGVAGRLNNQGQIVGNDPAGFVYDGGGATYLPGLGPQGTSAVAAINDAGQIAGASLTADNVAHAYLYSAGSMTDLGVLPGYAESSASQINAAGDVVGVSMSGDGARSRAFLYRNGTLTDLGAGGASGINASGVIVGTSQNRRAVLYQDGAVIDLGNFGDSPLTSANDVNDAGQIVGTSYVRLANNAYVNHPFLYESGTWRDLGLPAGISAGIPRAINNAGQVVGNSNQSLGDISRTPFLYTGGAMYNLGALLDSSGAGMWLELAYDINDGGVILAEGFSTDEAHYGYQAVLLTPVPEPGPWVAAGAAVVVGVATLRRRAARVPAAAGIGGASGLD